MAFKYQVRSSSGRYVTQHKTAAAAKNAAKRLLIKLVKNGNPQDVIIYGPYMGLNNRLVLHPDQVKIMNPESRFKKLEKKLAKSHGGSPSSYGGLAAYIGRKKYGAKKFEAMAKAGRKKARKNPRETATIPVRGIKIAKNGEIQILANPSSKRKLSNLAKRLGGKLY